MAKVPCSLCQQPVEARTLFSAQKLDLPLFDLIKRDRPGWPGNRGICTACHDQYRAKKLLSYLEAEYDKISEMEKAVAALQAPVIMMSQNRQAEKDRMQATQDYQINLMAEMGIRDLHDKLDGLRNRQWHELWHLQQRQLQLLEHLHKEISHPEDATAEPGPYKPPEI